MAEPVQNAQPNTQQIINVVMPGPDLRIEQFEIDENPMTTAEKWDVWVEDLEEAMDYHQLHDEKRKMQALKQFCGKEVKTLIRNLPDPPELQADEDGNRPQESDYKKTLRKLKNYFVPMRNPDVHVFRFLKMKQKPDETTTSYAARLRENSKYCNFGEDRDKRIREQLINTMTNRDLIRKAISKQWPLQELLAEAAQQEQTRLEVTEMRQDERGINKINHRSYGRGRAHVTGRGRGTFTAGKSQKHDNTCSYCGFSGKHLPGQKCPAFGKTCAKCGKMDHFASVCRNEPKDHKNYHRWKPPRGQLRGRGRGRYQNYNTPIRKTPGEDQHETDEDKEEDFIQHAIKNMKIKKTLHAQVLEEENSKAEKVKHISEAEWNTAVRVEIGDVPAMVDPDTGAFANVMDEYQFRALKKHTREKITLEEPTIQLKTIKSNLKTIGEFQTTIRNKHKGTKARIAVIEGRMDSLPLLCQETATELGFVKISKEGNLNGTNDLKIKQITSQKPEREFPECFEGIGQIKDVQNDKDIEVHLDIDKEATPVAQKPRHVAYHLVEPLKKWLEFGVKEQIFEKVPEGEAITWCSPLVVQPKPKFIGQEMLEPEQIRASIDLRVVNKAMSRSRIVQAPLVEDFTHAFHDCKIFSKLDLTQGYHQLTLDEESRRIATFSTPWGNYRPRRLVFGAKSSQDLFDETMYKIFGGIQHCLNQRDDILIGGRTIEEHDETLRKVLQQAKNFNITFNEKKCEFRTAKISFFGHRFTAEGLQPDPEKTKAVQECDKPKSKEEVRSFLGFTGYLADFIPRYSSIVAPLRELTKEKKKFRWEKEQEEAFKTLKTEIASERTMAYFNPKLPILVRTEAGFNEGLAAAIFQKHEDTWRPVHFISRTLSDTEKRYSQTEKDALAIVWAKNRFHLYLTGAPRFKIVTAHKPLIPMFNKTQIKLRPRIEKWVAEMQDTDFTLEYQPGKNEKDPLDYLSRHPLPETKENPEKSIKSLIQSTEKSIKWLIQREHAVILKDIQRAAETDEEIQEIMQTLKTGKWGRHRRGDLNSYYNIREELYEAEGILMRDYQIVLPRKLQRKIVIIAHEMGHMGISKTKELLRKKYWFPGMDRMVKDIIGRCYDCQVATKSQRNEPLKMTEIPEEAWHTVAMDFGGPYPDGHYNLVMVDKRSRYPVVEEVTSTNFKQTRRVLKGIFATYGTPNRVETDGGPPFNSTEFKRFAAQEGFEHHIVTPQHARANGEAERFMRTLGKMERIISRHTRDKDERRYAIQEMLTAYRDTPHIATGASPYEMMRERKIRTKLESVNSANTPSKEEIDKRDQEYKEKIKAGRENRNTKPHNIIKGDCVLVEQARQTKWTLPYEPSFYTVTEVNGSAITARRLSDGRIITRDGSRFKIANHLMSTDKPVTTAMDEDENYRDKEPEIESELVTIVATGEKCEHPADKAKENNTPPHPAETEDTGEPTATQANHAETLQKRELPNRERKQPRYLQDYVPK